MGDLFVLHKMYHSDIKEEIKCYIFGPFDSEEKAKRFYEQGKFEPPYSIQKIITPMLGNSEEFPIIHEYTNE